MATSRYAVGIAVGVIFGAVVGTGVSWAAVPDANGIIHGCYDNKGTVHALKVIDTASTATCPGGSTALNWNQTGPQGPQGAPGAAGQAGPQGPAGVSHAYQVTSTGAISLSSATLTTVVSLTLPPGDYLLSGIVNVNDVGGEQAECSVYSGPQEAGPISGLSLFTLEGGADEVDVPVTGYVVLGAPSTITLGCTSGTSALAGYGSSLTAVAVGAIN
jgi:hypothetical protein